MTDPIISIPSIQPSIVPLKVPDNLVAVPKVVVAVDRDYHISKNFTYGQLITTDHREYIQKNFDEGKKYIDHLTRLCNEILEPIVILVGVVPHINSAFRCPDLNTSIGASKTSQHMDAEAADTVYSGKKLKNVFNMIMASKLPYGQLIFEFDVWLHLSIQDEKAHPGKIRQNFVASSSGGKTIYTPISKPLI